MSRSRNPIPTPRCHKGSAVVDVYRGGKRRTVTLGPWGSPEAEKEFARLLAERTAAPATAYAERGSLTVAELLLAYLTHADRHYRHADGTPTGETPHVKIICRHVRELYGHTPAAEFGPLALKAVREKFIAAGWCRKSVNQQIERLRRAFK